ncbi:hypothetical protein QJU43_04760 [Pasteurella atlantica]|uniref:hypothetical protein n=1 Tax=Pasteurellaceae TaxID=712 RepID=UPI00276622FB|nr:hypothetical protein [Pasteurella atlantica]MDP8034332.1 hypothetical protein [Pasteurella atlantica]MDP8036282.1 hypothetical protein [Pasteurella atlantica]MDP8038215.1 hypothetical protein [Pasteurella atlantica]MDP8048587.1 hypothetical protein [Pasteurella atlantica]MDP8050526.1 hypothetical protein [Pasteurella atlantica]
MCWIIPLIVGLLSALLGYLIGKSKCEEHNRVIKQLTEENNTLKSKLSTCEKSLASSKTDDLVSASEPEVTAFSSSAEKETASVTFDANKAKAVFGKRIKENDLTIIEGIGVKIAELFNQSNITTWKQLGELSVEECQEILKKGGDRFKVHKPGTWPRQAKLAAEGEWQKLFDWQDQLDGGKE